MTLKAYRKAQSANEDPRTTEYRLFGQITGALIDAGKAGSRGTPLIDALDRNRRLWSLLAIDCADDGNRLPHGLRASIISLSIWVSKYSSEVVISGASLDPLIDVNRTVMQGLQSAA